MSRWNAADGRINLSFITPTALSNYMCHVLFLVTKLTFHFIDCYGDNVTRLPVTGRYFLPLPPVPPLCLLTPLLGRHGRSNTNSTSLGSIQLAN